MKMLARELERISYISGHKDLKRWQSLYPLTVVNVRTPFAEDKGSLEVVTQFREITLTHKKGTCHDD